MIGVYDYTVLLTYMGFASGVCGVIQACQGHLYRAIFCLMFAGLCDMFDGKVARTKKNRTVEEKHFGIQLDSLSDLVCFGVLPSVIGFMLCKDSEIALVKKMFLPLLVLFPLGGLIRLAWFNVLEIVRNGEGPCTEYTGLPITSSALIFPFIFIFRKMLGIYFPLVYAIGLLVVGLLFVVKIKIKKPSMKAMIGFIVAGVIMITLIIVVNKLL